MKHLTFTTLFYLIIKVSSAQPTIALQSYATGFSNPVDIANCLDERLFIVEQSGYIRIIDGQGNVNPQPFLDIDSRVLSGGERGLLGLAFHPDYKNNGFFFVNYTNNSGNTVISKFSVDGANPNLANAASEVILLTINQPYSNHNGGNLEFGPDGYLYIGTGDGGSGGDPDDNAQDPLDLLGKMLRLDVDTFPYQIPADNPFYGFASVRNEIWALGLRNPWRFSFDRLTGDLWIADVGQSTREEVDFQPAASTGGENYGWKCYEGNIPYGSSSFGCNAAYTFPVYDYDNNSIGCSITGGYVYRGCTYPNLFGQYVFCDYCSGRFWTLQNNGGGNFQTTAQLQSSSYRYVSFGEDMNGELYVAGLNGTIYRITETTAATLPTIAANPGTSICPGDSVTLSTQAGYASYDWKLNSTTSAGAGLQITTNTIGSYTLTAIGNNGCVYTTPATTINAAPVPTPIISASGNSFCAGDSLQLMTGNFNSYLWSDGSSASTAFAKQGGAYEVTVTDASGCTGSSPSFIVTENPLPVPVIQQTGYMCNGSSVVLSTDSYVSYQWSTSDLTQQITVSQSGSYDVSATDTNGCSGVSLPFVVMDNQFPKPVISSSNGFAFCTGDSTELSTSSSNVSLLWSTGDTVASVIVKQAGDYAVTVTDSNGCVGVSDTIVIIAYLLPTPEILPGNEVKQCGDGVIELTTSTAYSEYYWSRGDTTSIFFVISSGTFNLTVTDLNGCSGTSDSASVEFLPNPPQPLIFWDGGIGLSTDSGYSYQWYCGNNLIPGATDLTHVADWTDCNSVGNYTVEIIDSNGCSSISENQVVIWGGIEETWLGKISIQPNPFNSEIILNYTLNDLADLKIKLLDMAGKEICTVLNEKQSAGIYTISIHADKFRLSQGIYFLEMQNGLSQRTFKVVKL